MSDQTIDAIKAREERTRRRNEGLEEPEQIPVRRGRRRASAPLPEPEAAAPDTAEDEEE